MQGYTDGMREQLRASIPHEGGGTFSPTFADIVDIVRAPKGIISLEERLMLLNYVRSCLGLPPVVDEVDDDSEVEAEVIDDDR